MLYAALLTAEILEALPRARTVVLDGSFVQDPLYGALVQALVPASSVRVSAGGPGLAIGAALLASHAKRQGPAPLALERPDTGGLPDLSSYRARWRESFAKETLT